MPSTGRPVNQYLVIANVKLSAFGAPTYSYVLYQTPETGEHLRVLPGDKVAWCVRVWEGNRMQTQPYQITFANPAFFGTATLNVPAGGFSPHLSVVTILGKTKYTLSVMGINPADDPDIQIDTGTLHWLKQHGLKERVPLHYRILWHSGNGTMTYQVDGGAWQPFPSPLAVIPGDYVTFLVDIAAPFEVVFQPGDHSTPTPFATETNVITGKTPHGNEESTAEYPVLKDLDKDRDFTFSVTLENNAAKPSGNFVLRVAD